MRPTPRAKRATKMLARISEIQERRAHLEVVTTRRVLDEQSAKRALMCSAQSADEAEVLGGDESVSAGVIQLIGASRLTHMHRIDALDAAMTETEERLSVQREAHNVAMARQRTATKVSEHVSAARARELLQAEQKVSDDLSCARFARNVGPPGTP